MPILKSRDELAELLSDVGSKREACDRTGRAAGTIRWNIEKHFPELLQSWKELPSEGAFIGDGKGLPRPATNQAKADELVAAALAKHPLSPHNSQRANVIPVLCQMAVIRNSFGWERGWVRAVTLAFDEAGLPRPTSKVLRWMRSQLSTDPVQFSSVDTLDTDLLESVIDLVHR